MTTVDFVLPDGSEAAEPPEQRGLSRDGVRLLVARPTGIEHRRFSELPDLLEPGDLVVVNTSATLAAALDVQRAGSPAVLHVSGVLDDGDWVVELRLVDGPDLTARGGERVTLPGDLRLRLRAAYPDPSADRSRLWRATPSRKADVVAHLAAHGRPIGYRYLAGRYPLRDLQTVFARQPGSAEMPSAGRPFTADTVLQLVTRGIAVARWCCTPGCRARRPTSRRPPSATPCRPPPPVRWRAHARRAGGW